MRLLIYLALIYLAYRVIKSRLTPGGSARKTGHHGAAGEIDDTMIKDPVCGVYLSKKDGVHLKWKGEDLSFCSETCRDQFLAKNG